MRFGDGLIGVFNAESRQLGAFTRFRVRIERISCQRIRPLRYLGNELNGLAVNGLGRCAIAGTD